VETQSHAEVRPPACPPLISVLFPSQIYITTLTITLHQSKKSERSFFTKKATKCLNRSGDSVLFHAKRTGSLSGLILHFTKQVQQATESIKLKPNIQILPINVLSESTRQDQPDHIRPIQNKTDLRNPVCQMI
jgi:hypothetical protein